MKVFKYAIAYGMWLVDLGLSAWLFIMSRTVLLAFLALSYGEGDFRYLKRAELIDKTSTILLGLGWVALFVLTEGYYRAGALEGGLMKRFARVEGPILVCVFVVEGAGATDRAADVAAHRLKHHLNRHAVPGWMGQQMYLHPYPKELMLRNYV